MFHLLCPSLCLQGYEYQTVAGKCCGKCVQKSCIFITPDNRTNIIEVSSAASQHLWGQGCELGKELYLPVNNPAIIEAFVYEPIKGWISELVSALLFIQLNDTYVHPDDKCVRIFCEDVSGQLLSKEIQTSCPPFNPLDCEPVSILNISSCCPIPDSVKHTTWHVFDSSRAQRQLMQMDAASPVS